MIHKNTNKPQNKENRTSAAGRIYEEVTKRIIDMLMQGNLPWRQTWVPEKNGKSRYYNPYSGTKFSFLNQLLLGEPGLYATFNQIKEHGGHVLKGHKSRKVFFWSTYIPKKDQEEAKRLEAEGKSTEHLKQPCLREFDLFNLQKDTEGLDLKKFIEEQPVMSKAQDPTDIVQMVIDDYKTNESVSIEENGQSKPTYDATEDKVIIPMKKCYSIEEDYFASILSGLVHSTATPEREDRKSELDKMLSGEMSVREELIGEIGSSMILSACGLERKETHTQIAAQCQYWMKVLENDYRLLINSAGAAERSAKYVLGAFAQ